MSSGNHQTVSPRTRTSANLQTKIITIHITQKLVQFYFVTSYHMFLHAGKGGHSVCVECGGFEGDRVLQATGGEEHRETTLRGPDALSKRRENSHQGSGGSRFDHRSDRGIGGRLVSAHEMTAISLALRLASLDSRVQAAEASRFGTWSMRFNVFSFPLTTETSPYLSF